MPNLLAHYGAQGILTRGLFPAADARWILLGAFIPDVPWVVQRGVQMLLPAVDLHTVRIYAVVQVTLFFSLLLAAALALLARRPGLVFGVLSLNVLLHQILDGLQEKWGVGVHLLAPLRWDEWSLEMFSMEGWVTYGLTAAGLAFCIWEWRRRDRPEGERRRRRPEGERGRRRPRGDDPLSRRDPLRSPVRLGAAGLLVAAYFFLPLALLDRAMASNALYVQTLVEREDRPGRLIVLDRESYLSRADGDLVVHTVGDTLRVEGRPFDRSATVSARATFVDEETIRVHEIMAHRPFFRDAASYVGLLILAAFWLSAARSRFLPPRDRPSSGRGASLPRGDTASGAGTERPLVG